MERNKFERSKIYKYDILKRNNLEERISSPICLLIYGVFDSDSFVKLIKHYKIDQNPTVIRINKELLYLSFNAEAKYFNNLKNIFDILHYDVYSIFLKKSFIYQIIDEFKAFDEDKFHVYFEDNNNNISISKIINGRLPQFTKTISPKSKKYLYSFDNFSDLISFYIDIILNHKIWPVFAIYPKSSTFLHRQKLYENLSSNKLNYKSCPVFNPIKTLYYIGFIDKNPPKPQKMINVSELYTIKNIQDAQISYIYHKNDFIIKSFLGFSNKFYCLQVFDNFIQNSSSKFKSLSDFILINENLSKNEQIKYNFYYIEIQNIFDSSIFFSIENQDSFNFQNSDNSDELTTFLSFKEFNDFNSALQLLTQKVKYSIEDIKLFGQDDFNILFANQKANKTKKTKLLYLMFRIKFFQKNSLNNYQKLFPFLKKSTYYRKDVICSLDNKSYVVAGFSNDKIRNESFLSLKKMSSICFYYSINSLNQESIDNIYDNTPIKNDFINKQLNNHQKSKKNENIEIQSISNSVSIDVNDNQFENSHINNQITNNNNNQVEIKYNNNQITNSNDDQVENYHNNQIKNNNNNNQIESNNNNNQIENNNNNNQIENNNNNNQTENNNNNNQIENNNNNNQTENNNNNNQIENNNNNNQTENNNNNNQIENNNNNNQIENNNDDDQIEINFNYNQIENDGKNKVSCDKKLLLNKYKIIRRIGSGAFGIVYLVEDVVTNEKYAAKVHDPGKKNCQDLLQEIDFYTKFKHHLILSLHDYSVSDLTNKQKPVMILEFMKNGTLDDFLKRTRRYKKNSKSKQTTKYIILYGIVDAMMFLHNNGVIHRDLKPSNILLDENDYPRISDFGCAMIHDQTNKLLSRQSRERAGTPLYSAPEIFSDEKPYSFHVDVYSFSIIAYEIITGVEPFSERKFKNKFKFTNAIKSGVRPDISIIKNSTFSYLLQRCWSKEPSERPSFEDIFEIIKSDAFKDAFQVDYSELFKFLTWKIKNSQTKQTDQSLLLQIEQLCKNASDVHSMKKMADFGDPQSMVYYGKELYFGNNVPKDYKEAFKYFQMAAKKGNAEAMFCCGRMFQTGEGVSIDEKEASLYFQMSADLGNVNGMYSYADVLEYGKGVEVNYEKAIKYYKKAIDMGDEESMLNLGLIYWQKLNPPKMKKALKYLKMSADSGNEKGISKYESLLREISSKDTTDELLQEDIDCCKKDVDLGSINEFNKKQDLQNNNNELQIDENNNANQSDIGINKENQKMKTINEVEVHLHKSYIKGDDDIFIYYSHFTIPQKLLNVINNQLKNVPCLKKIKQDLCLPDNPHDIYTFYVMKSSFFKNVVKKLVPKNNIGEFLSTFAGFPLELLNFQGMLFLENILYQLIDEVPKNLLPQFLNFVIFFHLRETIKLNGIECFSPYGSNFLYFDESIIPESTLQLLLKFLNTTEEVKDIKRNVFDGKQIVTYIIIENNAHATIIKKIEQLLYHHNILFESFNYPLQQNIIIDERMILKDKNDFDIILKEIESIPIKPIKYERNKLYLYDRNDFNKLFVILSFICFQNETDKIIALNHINSIIFKGKENVLNCKTNLHYASINDSTFPKYARDQFPIIFEHFKGVEDIQRYAISIESPVERIYIGFDSPKHLKKGYYKFVYRMNILLYNRNPKLFFRKKDVPIYLVFQFRTSNMMNSQCFKKVCQFAADVQENCTEADRKPNENGHTYQYVLTYIGFNSEEDSMKAISIFKEDPEKNLLKFEIYKEGDSIINVSNDSKEMFLYYNSF